MKNTLEFLKLLSTKFPTESKIGHSIRLSDNTLMISVFTGDRYVNLDLENKDYFLNSNILLNEVSALVEKELIQNHKTEITNEVVKKDEE